jgi:hypothetical protein
MRKKNASFIEVLVKSPHSTAQVQGPEQESKAQHNKHNQQHKN